MATVSAAIEFPDHVPEGLRWAHSLKEFVNQGDDPFLAASRLHDGPDIIYARDASQGRPGWIVTRHALQQDVFVDFEHFSSKGGIGLSELLGVDWRQVPIDYDPPEQVDFRKIINPFFTPKAVNALEEPVRDTCDRLIAKFGDRGGCEFIKEFAIPFPSYIFLSLVGLPIGEAPQFLAWEEQLARGEKMEDRIAAGKAIMHYLEGFIEEQRENPATDLVRAVLTASVGDRPISAGEIMGMLYTFYLGGLDTVYSTLGWMMRYLATDEDLQRRLRSDPALIPQAVDELARAYSVTTSTRMVTADFTFHGVEMRKGDLVLLPLYLAGRDPKAWENPHEIDIGRNAGALTFASGPHLCVGRHLARRELRIALESFLTRFEGIRIKPGETYAYHADVSFGVDRLSLVWN